MHRDSAYLCRAAEADRLREFGLALLRYAPTPHIVIHLDSTPEASLGRSTTADLGLDDHQELDESVRESARMLGAKGCECHRRAWDCTSHKLRDLVLCAATSRTVYQATAPPSDAAVERLLDDLWAASQPRRAPSRLLMPCSPEERTSRSVIGEEPSPVSVLAPMQSLEL